MTNKRFGFTSEKIGNHWDIIITDYQTDEPFDDTSYDATDNYWDTLDNMEDLCLLLNNLHEENKKLVEDYHQVMVQKELLKYKLEKFDKVMQKYEIGSVEKLDKILMEQRVW